MARPKQPMLRMALFAGMLFLSRLSDGAAIGTPTKQVDKKSPADDKKPKDAQKADESMSGNRRKRPDRWGIQLTYNNGEELYDEWAKLNAVILVGPTMEEVKKNSFLIFRDLSLKPPQGNIESTETLRRMNRVWFISRDPIAVEKLSKFLGLNSTPPFIAFFIPRELEDELLKQELAYGNKTEKDLNEGWFTVFEVRRNGEKFDARVLSQKKEESKM